VIHFGWSEPATTSAPVQEEAVQAILGMNKKTHPYPMPRDFSALFSAPKFSPPNYLPHLISHSLHLQSSKEFARLSSTKLRGDVRHKA
jgi:hypothetical protein